VDVDDDDEEEEEEEKERNNVTSTTNSTMPASPALWPEDNLCCSRGPDPDARLMVRDGPPAGKPRERFLSV
jgi:hypothetical protein